MPYPNFTASDVPAFLRQISILSFLPALIMLIIHGIISGLPFPALGLVPLSASTAVSAFVLYRDQVAAIGSPVQALTDSNIFFIDVFIAIIQMALLIPSWVIMSAFGHRGHAILAAYCTMFMIVDFGVHTFFAFEYVVKRMTDAGRLSVTFTFNRLRMAAEYTPLTTADDEQESDARSFQAERMESIV